MTPFWKTLRSKELISQKKFDRLTRNTGLTDEELSAFVARQIVETGQSVKAAAQLLQKRYQDTKIEYIKAGLVSDFRHVYKMVKSRDVNDFHHAKDAYLNIVVGNVYTVKARKSYFIRNIQNGTWSMNRMFDYTTTGAWTAENDESLNLVKSTMAKNNIRFTRYSFKQKSIYNANKKAGLFNQKPVKKCKGENEDSLVPLKKGMDTKKYGGYSGPTSTYFAFVEYTDKKGHTVRSFEPVDLYIEKEYRENPELFMKNRLKERFEAEEVKILIPCVKYNALISIDGFRMHISSKSSGGSDIICKPAVQLVLNQQQEIYVKKISKYLEKCVKLRYEKPITKFDEITLQDNMDLYDTLIDKMKI